VSKESNASAARRLQRALTRVTTDVQLVQSATLDIPTSLGYSRSTCCQRCRKTFELVSRSQTSSTCADTARPLTRGRESIPDAETPTSWSARNRWIALDRRPSHLRASSAASAASGTSLRPGRLSRTNAPQCCYYRVPNYIAVCSAQQHLLVGRWLGNSHFSGLDCMQSFYTRVLRHQLCWCEHSLHSPASLTRHPISLRRNVSAVGLYDLFRFVRDVCLTDMAKPYSGKKCNL